jgi:hypothetical protein|tara:strand:+ start:233 stop:358 length:126 start_codon:yes stop_codon:yes gene_type:complete
MVGGKISKWWEALYLQVLGEQEKKVELVAFRTKVLLTTNFV